MTRRPLAPSSLRASVDARTVTITGDDGGGAVSTNPAERTRFVAWSGDEDPDRLEAVTITLAADRFSALGTSRAADYTTSWALETGSGWVTERLEVGVTGLGWWRHLTLVRDPAGHWTSEAETEGEADLPSPGIVDAASIDGANDCDLALCPVTNSMPILRLGLLDAVGPATALVMAWVDLPSLQVIRSDQVYSGVRSFDAEVGSAVVRYESANRAFMADLTVDEDGVVIDYPWLAKRLE
ncbi:putative glycolipid-binding domain-containing protein [Diaminobutyricibacter tongyongensis]|uniref:putative glycolipid-binding domain-containing protein n=1 Tax=Leifsonia tongyongensis TaxID=1268043 RepID=UPI00308423E7